jgi:ribosomal protein L11 methyltransferase
VREALINFLIEQTNRGVQVEGEWVTAFCRPGSEARNCLDGLSRYYLALQQLHADLPGLEIVQDDLEEKEWSEAWKAYFKPLRIGKNIVVRPTWEPFLATGREVVIAIDPGRAFGTGKHASTALCIEILEQLFSDILSGITASVSSVLDVGTGSGILGIVAARLGVQRVLGLDIDPVALEAAARNLERNRVGEVMQVEATPVAQVQELFEVVVANLTATVLMQLSASLVDRVDEKGWLVLGGVLADQVQDVGECFQPHGFQLIQSRSEEEWAALLLRRT